VKDIDWSDEAVAALGERLNITGAVGGVAEGFADLVDGGAEGVVEVYDRVTTPETELKFVAGYYLAGMLEQRGQNLEGLSLQLDPKASLP
jgi:hypothetical protein